MSEKLQKILEEIKLGQRKSTYDVEITLQEYLSKDQDGISFLEHLLKNNINIKSTDEQKFGKYFEIVYLYCKYNKSLYYFNFEEEDLFKITNGKRLIDFFKENKKNLSRNIIQSIKNHVEIVDIVISANVYNLDYINSKIIEKLMIPDSNGTYPIEKYINDERVFKYLIPLINNSKDLIELCKKYDKYDLLENANEKVLMYKLSEDHTLLDDLYSKNIIPKALERIPENIDFVNYLRKNNLYEYLKEANEEVLLLEIEQGKTLLEELIEKNLISKLKIPVSKKQTFTILYKMNKLDLLGNVSEVMSKKSVKEIFDDNNLEDKSFLEYMLDKGYNPLSETFLIMDKDIIKMLSKKGYYEFLGEKISYDNDLFIEVEAGILLIDKLLENNVDIEFGVGGFDSIDIAKKLYEKNRYDLLIKGKIPLLLKSLNEKDTYFDYILENIKNKNIKYNLNDFTIYHYSANIIAKFYLTIAKHDMMKYINELSEKELLEEYDGKTLLDTLLDLDSELTFNKVLSDDVKSKIKIAIILKSHGLEQNNIDLPLEESNFTEEYLNHAKESYGIGPLPAEGEFLLKKLNDLFLSDGKSDPSLVSALISGYRRSLFVNYNLNIQELRNLVEVKEKNLNRFKIIKDGDSGYFKRNTGAIHCDNTVIETLLHETGHALHSYLANNNVPEEYEEIVERVRLNPEVLKKVEEYANKYNDIKKEIKSIVEEKYKDFLNNYYNEEKIKQIEEFIKKSQVEKKEEFKSLGISEENLDIILNNLFTTENYIDHQKRIFINEYTDVILRNEFGSFMAIGDILDAIYEGELHSKVLKNEKGENIKGTAGHGISYYSGSIHGFDEMVANFASIVKSKDAADTLSLIKNIVGDELYNLLSEFYYNNIVVSKENKIEDIKLL